MPAPFTYPTPFRLASFFKIWRKLPISTQGSLGPEILGNGAAQFAGTTGVAILVENVRQEAALRVTTMSANKRGPCYSGILDAVTGEMSYGENFDMSTRPGRLAYESFYVNAHPVLKLRIDTHNQNLHSGIAMAKDTAGAAGTHSEIVALDKAFKKRQQRTSKVLTDADINTFYLHNRCTMTAKAGQPMDRCDNCRVITAGINIVLHT